MCGIFGVVNLRGTGFPGTLNLRAALDSMRHRGPDSEGVFRDGRAILGVRRLAIIDPEGGDMPIHDEANRLHIVMNGEIYDHERLKEQLEEKGHRFRSRSDVEAALHLFEDHWTGALDHFDGQYALAVYDATRNRVLLARDRMGICPLYYATAGDRLVFASEPKAIFASGLLRPAICPRGLDAILAFGCVPPPRSVFQSLSCLPAGHFLELHDGVAQSRRYWDIPYPPAGEYPRKSDAAWAEECRESLQGAVRRRLRADVPVGMFLSGGIDSGAILSVLDGGEGVKSRVYSIDFSEPRLSERRETLEIARFLGAEVEFLPYDNAMLARDFPLLVRHADTPLIATESAPLMALSGLAASRVKVVLTGEGSDEALGGYGYFHLDAMRRTWEESTMGRVGLRMARGAAEWLVGPNNPLFPARDSAQWAEEVFGFRPAGLLWFHVWRKIRDMVYSTDMLERQRDLSDAEFIDLPQQEMMGWDPLNRSLYISARIFLQGHLLAAHGDRALMANSVEGRYPFLDREVVEFFATVPPELKIRRGREKYLLRMAMRGRLPTTSVWRRKRMFMAPLATPFIGRDTPAYTRELLSARALRESGYFDPGKVAGIIRELSRMQENCPRLPSPIAWRRTYREGLLGAALVFVLSTQILENQIRQKHEGLPV